MSRSRRAAARINSVLTGVTVFLLIVLCLVTFLQVVTRYVFNSPLSWTEEVVRYLLVWITFLGFGLVTYKKTEMSVSFFTQALPARTRRMLDIAVLFLVLAFLAVFVAEGFIFAFESTEILTIALQIPFLWINISAPIGGVCLFALYLLRLVETVVSLKGPDEPAPEGACPPEEVRP